MNDNWIEIVETLQPHVKCNSTELKYQQEIENCLKFLGWRTSNKTMQSQLTLGFGAGNTLRPDIILYKNDIPVLPIEIKRPILRGRDIKRYGYDWANLWLINTHNGIKGVKPRIDINDYPAVKAHLDQYWDKISKRADKGDTPYNLRNCAYLDV